MMERRKEETIEERRGPGVKRAREKRRERWERLKQ